MSHHEQVGKGCQHLHLAAVLEHASQPGLLKAELPFDHAERILHLGAKVRLLQAEVVPTRRLLHIDPQAENWDISAGEEFQSGVELRKIRIVSGLVIRSIQLCRKRSRAFGWPEVSALARPV
jgi:hypothetical protein